MALVPALEKGNALRLKLRTAVAVAVIAPTLAVPAAAGATTVIGSGSSAEQPILTRAVRRLSQARTTRSSSSTRRTAATPGSRTCSPAQPVRRQHPGASSQRHRHARRPSCTWTVCAWRSTRPTRSRISRSRNAANIFLARITSWTKVPSSSLSATIDPIGRDSTAGSYTYFQQAVLEWSDAGKQRPAAGLRRPGGDGHQERPQRDRLRGPGALGQRTAASRRSSSTVWPAPDQHQVPEVPAEPVHLGRALAQATRASRPPSSSTGCGPARRPGTIIAKAGAVPAFNKKARKGE